jgi:hypothetical protein
MRRFGYVWVAGLAIVSYRQILGFWFTGLDTFSLIYTASSTSLWEVFTTPMMGNSNFMMYGAYWRPVISLMFWLSGRVFYLEPGGYFVVNLLWHALAAVLVVALGCRLAGWWVGVVAGHIFIAHPLLMENVPVISRGQDIVVAVFVLATLCLVLAGRDRWALVTYALALLSKEPGILALPMVAVVLWYQHRLHWRSLWPMVAVTGVYMTCRWWVLGGLGGYSEPADQLMTVLFSLFYYPLLWSSWGIGQHIKLLDVMILAATTVILAGALWPARKSKAVQMWLLSLGFPLLLFTATAMQFWYFYLPAALFSLLMASAIKELRDRQRWGHLLVTAMLLAMLLVNRPNLNDWRRAGEVNREIVTKIEHIDQRPLYIAQIPYAVNQPPGGVRGLSFIEDHGLQSYLALQKKNEDVFIITVVRLRSIPDNVNFQQSGPVAVMEHGPEEIKNCLYSYWTRKDLLKDGTNFNHSIERTRCSQTTAFSPERSQ